MRENMEEKVIAVISTDWHLKSGNMREIMDLVSQQVEVARTHGCDSLFCLGDVFDSRVSQREEVLNTFTDILDMLDENGMRLYCIPGNHDKTDYTGDRSFLSPFAYHPALVLFEIPTFYILGGLPLFFMPFYDTDVWMPRLSESWGSVRGASILMSHVAVNGSVNNDGSTVESRITPTFLKERFRRVYLGHYHNAQEVAEGIIHLPSIQQNNFGEDPEKGFALLFGDGDFEFVKSSFKEYVNVKVDANAMTKSDMAELLKLNADGRKHVKVEVTGSEAKLKTISEELFSENGIVLKKKRKDLDTDIAVIENATSELSKAGVKELFNRFCEEKGYDRETGYEFLKKYVE